MDIRVLTPAQHLPAEPQDGAELRKPHEMIVMVPRSKRVTLTGRRIYNALLQVSQARLAAMATMPPADYMFEAPLPAILRTTGSNGEDRTAAKRYLKEMRGLEVDWESTAQGDGVKWRGFSMLAEVAIEVRGGENWVSWSYPPTIMAALREPSRWARIDLDILASLSTYAAVALYEICARYRDNPSGVTSRKPTNWWADALSHVPANAERREWRKFKNERVKPAIEEINSETDLQIELLEHKQGRAVQEVQFAVRKKRLQPPRSRALNEVVDANLVLRAESLGIRELKMEQLVKEFGDAKVREQLELLERRCANKNLRRIDNAYSYLRSLLRNELVEGDWAREPQSSIPAVPLVTTPARAQPLESDPRQNEDPAEAWLSERVASIRADVQTLSADQRQQLIREALDELTSKKMATAVVTRRAAQGDALFGLLGTVVVRLYGTRLYGPDWNKQPAKDLFTPPS